MSEAQVEIEGKPYVLIPRSEYDRLRALSAGLPPLPKADARGHRPAVKTAKVLIARGIMRRRLALGLEQKDLAAHAKVRSETISRLESGKHRPQQQTLEKIDQVLRAIEQRKARKGQGKARASTRLYRSAG